MSNPQILRDFFRSTNKIGFLISIKSQNFLISFKKFNQLTSHPIFKNLIYNKFNLPKNYSELGVNKNILDSNNIEGELAWNLISVLHYKNYINGFLVQEREYQKNLLLTKYDKCLEILEKIENEICCSLWSLENKFSIKQREGENERNWGFLQEINNTCPNNNVLFFSYFFSKKAESGYTVLQYKRDLETTIDGLTEKDSNYVIFKLGHLFKKDFGYFSQIVNLENNYSIVDKYLTLIEILTELACDKSNFGLIKEILDVLISNKFVDFRINRLYEIVNNDSNILKEFNTDILSLYDKYSIGDFKESLEVSKKLISNLPENLDLYEIYVKCLLELNEDFIPTSISPFIDEILKSFYSIFSKDIAYIDSKENLLKLYLCFSKHSFFKQIFSVTKSLTDFNFGKNVHIQYFINSVYTNPQLVLLSDLKDRLEFDKDIYAKHVSCRINNCIAKNNAELLDQENIPEYKKLIYKARSEHYNSKKPNLEIFLEAYNKNVCSFHREENILMLYEAYIKYNMYDKIVTLIVDTYFENKFYIERINTLFLLNSVIDMNYNLKTINQDLPILFFLEQAESYYLYATLDVFLNSINVSKPSEINAEFLDEKLIFLLKNLCTIEVLNNFYLTYENIDEVISERIEILKILISKDDKNIEKYIEEIEEIVKNQKVNKAFRTINDGKISLNFNRIKEDKEFNLESNFNRFKKFKNFSGKIEFNLVDIVELLNSSLNEEKSRILKAQDASFSSFKSLFFEIIDHFLFSKEHGLDGDLSTRIRHGVLENQIRSVFSSNDLIANKGNDIDYNDIEYWKSKFYEKQVDDEISIRVQKALKKFSNSIDFLINELNKEYIQILSNRHTSKKKGLFNYNFSDDIIWVFYNEITEETTYEEFLDNVFEILRIYTLNSLNVTTNFLKEEINTKIQKLIENLQEQLNIELKDEYRLSQEFNNKISRTKTQIETELYDISKWFKFNNSNILNLDIETIVHVAIESINLFSSVKINPKLNLNVESQILKGYYYIDILKILIQNITTHSKIDIDKLKIEISVDNEIIDFCDYSNSKLSIMTIVVKNNLMLNDLGALENKLIGVKNNWNTELDAVNTEGGSGFQKIERILRYDLKVIRSAFDFEITDNNLSIILKITNPFNN